MTVQSLLEAIAALPEAERLDLLSRLREIYGAAFPLPGLAESAPAQPAPADNADYLIVFDGGSRGNPGPAYGSYIIFDALGSGQIERREYERALTNNEAEYTTLLHALSDLLARLGGRAASIRLKLLTDSLLVVSQINGQWEAREPRLRELRDQARGELRRFSHFRLVHQARDDIVQILGH